jgi:hypothetical protein
MKISEEIIIAAGSENSEKQSHPIKKRDQEQYKIYWSHSLSVLEKWNEGSSKSLKLGNLVYHLIS